MNTDGNGHFYPPTESQYQAVLAEIRRMKALLEKLHKIANAIK